MNERDISAHAVTGSVLLTTTTGGLTVVIHLSPSVAQDFAAKILLTATKAEAQAAAAEALLAGQ